MSINKLENNKVVESWGYWPDYTIIHQMKNK